MDPLTYLQKVGRKKADRVAKRARLNPVYFNHICYGHRSASVRAAQRLVTASLKLTPETPMSLLGILQHRVRRSGKNGTRAVR